MEQIKLQDKVAMKLTIEISCNSGLDMEENLNKAIYELSNVLKRKGFGEFELTGYMRSIDSKPIYKILLTHGTN